MKANDPYALDDSKILEAPTTLSGSVRHLGPGFILSASIVGSGELVATTQLGANAGFVAMWVILVSCLVKVALQLEFGKRAIMTGETTFASFNTLPGPKLGRAHLSIWAWLLLMVFKFLQVGGIVGLVAVLLHMAMPGVALLAWLWVVVALVAAIVFSGYYRVLELLSILMIGLFTLFTLVSLIALQSTDAAIGIKDVFSGLTFSIPPGEGMLLLVIGAFGITGVGGDEIMHYNYWLIEKGYAAHSGRNDGSDAWERRAKGWIRVMYIDAIFAMLVYTVVTVAFFLLGSALLHGQGDFSEGGETFLKNLSSLYTATLGGWSEPLFYFGAFVVLFSTAFSALGAWTRQITDAFGQIGILEFANLKQRRRWIGGLALVIPVIWGLVYLSFQNPVWMVFVGGFVTSIILLVVLFAAIVFKSRRSGSVIRTGLRYEVAFWLSAAMILFVGIWSVTQAIRKGREKSEQSKKVAIHQQVECRNAGGKRSGVGVISCRTTEGFHLM
ncbi:MAG: Nramp family divalent metal transporter [Verrucomicrobiales bacterium]|nr:Nramp family divalent metal transporter [Verrucomicrobiales bacterium]MED5585766.1 Nramp family divalent metal transporter [Verrucomicrobiota bacterium]